ncbi:MAG: hypothetical protein GY823_01725 [Flavobacteriaceae bacterium]|nr:hypothetical protein [Flavobacteriaceae bacterium]
MYAIKDYYTRNNDEEFKNSISRFEDCAKDGSRKGYIIMELLQNDLGIKTEEEKIKERMYGNEKEEGFKIFKRTLPNKEDRIRQYIKLFKTLYTLHYNKDLKMVLNDIKPENLMMDNEGNLKFIDLGLSDRVGGSLIGGTPAYMPPERINSHRSTLVSYDNFPLALTILEVESGLLLGIKDSNCGKHFSNQCHQKILPGLLQAAGIKESDLQKPCENFGCVMVKALRYDSKSRYDDKTILNELKRIYPHLMNNQKNKEEKGEKKPILEKNIDQEKIMKDLVYPKQYQPKGNEQRNNYHLDNNRKKDKYQRAKTEDVEIKRKVSPERIEEKYRNMNKNQPIYPDKIVKPIEKNQIVEPVKEQRDNTKQPSYQPLRGKSNEAEVKKVYQQPKRDNSYDTHSKQDHQGIINIPSGKENNRYKLGFQNEEIEKNYNLDRLRKNQAPSNNLHQISQPVKVPHSPMNKFNANNIQIEKDRSRDKKLQDEHQL